MAKDYSSIFESNRNKLPENACSNLSYTRENALRALESTGLPNNRLEYWKYSRIGKVLSGLDVNLANDEGAFSSKVASLKNANFELSTLGQAIADNHPLIEQYLGKYAGIENAGLTALNTAFFSNGIFLHVPDDTIVEDPIYLPHQPVNADGGIFQPRNLIVVGRNSSVKLISNGKTEANGAMVNAVEEIAIGENAELNQYVLQNDGGNIVNGTYVRQERDSRYTRVTTTLEGSFVRNNVNVRMEGTGCESNLYGYYHIRGKNQVDNHTIIEHKKPDCVSNELYVGLLDGESSGIFNGRVLVHQDAQRTNAFQSNKNILLSDNATMNTKPELEIYADDVKCSHGATIGQVDQEALFYLRSRGIPKQIAMSMLLQGFSVEVTEKIADDTFREKVIELILAQLNG
ncbi:MAG: Fe-S cluster assembly protein SufD [Flavobacteriales bacterium]|nr:Fe-S cluster assembly protein SufD [Flavobacteriales bacterium]MBL4735598.1 Fe-S cluster assembly protein SufD [Flavobacteriales bacterium]